MKTNKLILTAAIISCVGSTTFAENIDNSVGGNARDYNAVNSLFIGKDHTINVASADFAPAENVAMLGDDNHMHPNVKSALVTGHDNHIDASYTVTGGMHNTVHKEATYALTAGWQNSNMANSSLVVGHTNHAGNADNILMFGYNNTVTNGSNNSFAGGDTSEIDGKNSFAFGDHAKAEGNNVYAIGKEATASAENTLAFGNQAQATMNNSVALGNYSVTNTVQGTSSISINGKTHNFAGVTPVGTVSIGNSSKERTITNVAAGRLDANSTDVINGSQLHAVVTEVESNRARINSNLEALSNHEGHIQTVENKVDNNTTDIQQLMQSINTTNIVLTDAINQGKSYTDSEVAKVGAASAALSALHPLEFNKDDKWQFAVGFGNYKNKTATAIGAFYQPNENILLSLGTTLGTKNNMVNGGATFRFGKNSTMNTDKQIATDTKVQNLEQRLAEIEAKYNELLAKVESK